MKVGDNITVSKLTQNINNGRLIAQNLNSANDTRVYVISKCFDVSCYLEGVWLIMCR